MSKTKPAQCCKIKQSGSTESFLNSLKYNVNRAFNYKISDSLPASILRKLHYVTSFEAATITVSSASSGNSDNTVFTGIFTSLYPSSSSVRTTHTKHHKCQPRKCTKVLCKLPLIDLNETRILSTSLINSPV